MVKIRRFITGLVSTGLLATGAFSENPVSKSGFEALKPQRTEQQTKAPAPVALSLPDGLTFGALVEVEAAYSQMDSDDESDITLATVELSAGWQLLDRLRGDLMFLYEENDTEPMEVDQAFLTFGNTEQFPLFLQAGKMYVPFGNLESFFISDPIVLELAETRETAALLGFEKGGFSASLTVFNGDVGTRGENQIENAVAAASYCMECEHTALSFGAAWIRNIMESDGLTGVLDDAYGYTYTADDTGGVNAWLTATYGPATLIAEVVRTLDKIEVDGAGTGLKPESLNLELGCDLTDRLNVAAKYEMSDDVADWFAETRYGAAATFLLAETQSCCIQCSLEYMKEDFGGGAEDADVVTVQLAFGF